jgi:hypothetical protein
MSGTYHRVGCRVSKLPPMDGKNDNQDPNRAPPSDNPQAEVRHLLTQDPPAPVDVAAFGTNGRHHRRGSPCLSQAEEILIISDFQSIPKEAPRPTTRLLVAVMRAHHPNGGHFELEGCGGRHGEMKVLVSLVSNFIQTPVG